MIITYYISIILIIDDQRAICPGTHVKADIPSVVEILFFTSYCIQELIVNMTHNCDSAETNDCTLNNFTISLLDNCK